MASNFTWESLEKYIQDTHVIDHIEERQRLDKENTERINNFITKQHCNIINYMPLELMRSIIHRQYNNWALKYRLKVFYKGKLYDVSDLIATDIREAIDSDIIYATTIKMIPVDYLEAYIGHSYGGV